MAITIKLPKKVGSSNKTHNPPKNPLKPHIDKLTVTLTLDDEAAHDSYMALFQNLDADDLFLNETQAKIPGYNLAKRIVLPSTSTKKKLPLLHAKHIKDKQLLPKLRLEFVPVDLGPQGMEEFHIQLTSIVEGGWDTFIKSATITRIDVAVDIPGISMDGVHILPAKAATSQRWAQNGQLETVYIGQPKSNQIAVYERGTKRKKLGQEWPCPPSLRIERRMKHLGGKKLTELKYLANPFKGTNLIIKLPGPPNPAKAWEWALFSDAVQVRGLTAALALLPEDRRTKYRKHIKDHALPAWDPDAIWKIWKAMLDELKIASDEW